MVLFPHSTSWRSKPPAKAALTRGSQVAGAEGPYKPVPSVSNVLIDDAGGANDQPFHGEHRVYAEASFLAVIVPQGLIFANTGPSSRSATSVS